MNTKTKILLIVSLSVVGFYLLAEHRAHIFGNSQYLLFILFALMHLFMHAGHGDHAGRDTRRKEEKQHEH